MDDKARSGDVESVFLLPFKINNLYNVFGVIRHVRGVTYVGYVDLRRSGVDIPSRVVVARLLTDTNSPDPTFGNNGVAEAIFEHPLLSNLEVGLAMVPQDDGGMVVVVRDASHWHVAGLAKFTSAGQLDTSFGEGGVIVHHIAESLTEVERSDAIADPQNFEERAVGAMGSNALISLVSKSLLYAYDTSIQGTPGVGLLARFLPDGMLDKDFGEDGVVRIVPPEYVGRTVIVHGATVLPDGRIAVVGFVYRLDGTTLREIKGMIFRCLADGTADKSFGDDGFVLTSPPSDFSEKEIASFQFKSVSVGLDESLVCSGLLFIQSASGRTETIYGTLHRFDGGGQLDQTFNGEGVVVFGQKRTANYFNFVGLQHNGKIVAGGHLEDISEGGQSSKILVARFNADGARDISFARQGWATATLESGRCFANSMFVDEFSITLGGTYLRTANSPRDAIVINFTV